MEMHEYANLFPMMSDDELRGLADDIRENGQHQPILKTEDGRILDGRNRLRACEIAGVQPDFKVWKGSDDEALKFVLSLNLTRRHLDESQRAMIAASIATLRPGEKSNPQICGSESKVTQAAAAELLNTSERQVQKAVRVRREAAPEVVAKVESGKLSLNAAEKTIAPKTRDLKADRLRVFEELANSLVPCSFTDLQVASADRFAADRLLPKSNNEPRTFAGEQLQQWLRGSKTFEWNDNGSVSYRKGKAPKQTPASSPAADTDVVAFDELTSKVQEYLESAAQRVPESMRQQWRAFLQRVLEGLQS